MRNLITNIETKTLQDAAVADGNGTAFSITGLGTLAMQVVIVGAGTTQVNFEVTVNNTNWVAIKGTTVPATSSLVSTTIVSGMFQFDVGGFSQFRARISNTVGVVAVTAIASGVTLGTGGLSSETDTELETDDLDTGVGTDTQAIVGIALAESGGHALLGSAKPMPLIAGQTSITGAAGVVAANTPRITHASDDPVTTSLQIIDDWDESDRAKVNPIVGQAGVAAGAGAVGVTVPRTTLASDDPAVTALQIVDDWDESDRAKVNVNLNAGVAVDIGIAAAGLGTARVALATDQPDINVDIPNNLLGITAKGQGTMANSLPVTLASNQSSIPVASDTELTTKDYDTGAGTENVAVVGVIVPAVGGSVAITGDAGNGLDVDVTRISNILDVTAKGQATMANSLPVALASDQGDINVDIPNNLLGITAKGQAAMANSLPVTLASDEANPIVTALQIIDNMISGNEAQVDVITSALPTGAATEATLAAASAKLPATLGQKASVASLATVLSTEQETILTALKTALEIIDNVVSGNEAQVDIVTLPQAATVPYGTVSKIGRASCRERV